MKQIIISFCLLVITVHTHLIAQDTTVKYVLGSTGETLSNTTVQVSFTLGELAIDTYSIPGVNYKEGFLSGKKSTQEQTIILDVGWNLISFNIIPLSDSTEVIFEEIMPLVSQIKKGSQIYDPSLPPFLNTLIIMDYKSGYWVNMIQAATLNLSGDFVDRNNTPIQLNPGWNLVAYFADQTNNSETAIQSITNTLLEVKHFSLSYNPLVPPFLNTLSSFEPGKGYWINVSELSNLVYNF